MKQNYELMVFRTKEDSEWPLRICCFSKNLAGTLDQAKNEAAKLAKEFDSYSCAVMLNGKEVAHVIQ
jgi:hypothetical protein